MDNLQHNQIPIHTIVKNIKGNTTNKGIYKIACIVNNKFYIGSSIEIDYRMRAHISMLRKNKHKNKHLQAAFNKYRENNFIIECIEACPDTTTQDEIILLEQKYLDTLKPWNNNIGYNMSEKAYCPPSRTGTKLTKEHKQIISKANRGKVVSEVTRQIKSLQRKGKTLKEINGEDWIDKRKGKTAKQIYGIDWVDSRIGVPRTKEVCKKISDLKGGNTLLTLQNKFTNILQTKTCYEWRKEGVDIHALKHNRQNSSKGWKLYSSFNPP
jgi:group I intron endonuclease